jgi:hypothetical protein
MKSPKKYGFHLVLPFILLLLAFLIVSLINKPKHKEEAKVSKSSIHIQKLVPENKCGAQFDCPF